MAKTRDVLTAATALGVIAMSPHAVTAQRSDDRSRPRLDAVAVDSVLQGASVVLGVDGLSCPLCAYGLQEQLKRIPALDSLVIRIGDGLVFIRTAPDHAIEDGRLAEAVQRGGFTLREIVRVRR